MTGAAPGTSGTATPTDTPDTQDEVAGESPSGQDGGTGGGAVQIAYLHGGSVSHSWAQCMMNLLAYDKTVGSNAIRSLPFAVSCSGPNSIPEARNLAVKYMLDQTDHEWLFFVDTDMGFNPEALDRLLFAADPVERPVVGGLCFAMKHVGGDGKGGFIVRPMPTLYMWAEHAEQGVGFANRFRYPPETLVRVAGTGAAFLLIHRGVLEVIRQVDGDHWFDLRTYDDGTSVSEDLSFCWRVGQLGARIFVHTGVKTTHHKQVWLGEDAYSMPDEEPMAHLMVGGGGQAEQTLGALGEADTLGHPGSDRWTGGDKKDAD